MALPNLLRPITQRLNDTPVKDLPNIVYFLASSISNCSQALQASKDTRGDETTVLVHKLRTKISSLLQDRTPEGRLAAVVLIKAVIESGGREHLSIVGPWIRGLLALLNKPDSVATKKLCLLTITRIFSLTQAHPTLVREITTPLLPAFIDACLKVLRPRNAGTENEKHSSLSPLLVPVLQCLLHLISHHPSTFRPYVANLQMICLKAIDDGCASSAMLESATDLITALHFAAPKNSSATQWASLCRDAISSAHNVADQIFRSEIEDWVTSDPIRHQQTVRKSYDGTVHGMGAESLILSSWSGIQQGSSRMKALLRILESLLTCQDAQAVSFPIGLVVDLIFRILSVVVSSAGKESKYSARPNPEINPDERNELWMELPAIHAVCIEILSNILVLFQRALLPIIQVLFEQTAWVFGAEKYDPDVRMRSFDFFREVLTLIGPSLTKSDAKLLTPVAQECCLDLSLELCESKSPTKTQAQAALNPNGTKATNADSFLSSPKDTLPDDDELKRSRAYCAAHSLLPALLKYLPDEAFPLSVRAEMDRTAVLIQHEQALIARVLNPGVGRDNKVPPASLLPFLARTGGAGDVLEALLRPRASPIKGGSGSLGKDTKNHKTNEQDVREGSNHNHGGDLWGGLHDSLDTPTASEDAENVDEVTEQVKGTVEKESTDFTVRSKSPSPRKRDFSSYDENLTFNSIRTPEAQSQSFEHTKRQKLSHGLGVAYEDENSRSSPEMDEADNITIPELSKQSPVVAEHVESTLLVEERASTTHSIQGSLERSEAHDSGTVGDSPIPEIIMGLSTDEEDEEDGEMYEA